MPAKSETDVGLKRLYQAWVAWPTFLSEYGEWIHGQNFAVGNPRIAAKDCKKDLEAWFKRNKKHVIARNREVQRSFRVGSNDTRVIGKVYQIWPMTDISPWNAGMFSENIEDPFT